MRLRHIIVEEIDKTINYDELFSSFTWRDVDFIEGDICKFDNCERLYVTVKGIQIPINIIDLNAQQTRLGKIQLHIFINDRYQGRGIATKIYTSFIHQFGGIYSGYKRIMNNDAILSIYDKLKKEPDIEVKEVYGYNNEAIGIEAYLKK